MKNKKDKELVQSELTIDMPDSIGGWRRKATFEITSSPNKDEVEDVLELWDLFERALHFITRDSDWEIKVLYDGEEI